MDLKKIKGLVEIIENSSLTEFTYSDENIDITMTKVDYAPGKQVITSIQPGGNYNDQLPTPTTHEASTEKKEDESRFITSPIVGTFYSSPSPDEPAFVRVGDKIKNGQTVCILEAMKLMNEIEADFDCEIEAVLVSNEQKVEYGQPLFRVKKL
ncbi:MAG: acetyl-CoA carboxylase biotin carboxyl carrier protein [Eubacteriales bacterium]|nr:acetyl-CoA carboxylase biotin carboxyl carrier protein [Eubacteriales bacterium]